MGTVRLLALMDIADTAGIVGIAGFADTADVAAVQRPLGNPAGPPRERDVHGSLALRPTLSAWYDATSRSTVHSEASP